MDIMGLWGVAGKPVVFLGAVKISRKEVGSV